LLRDPRIRGKEADHARGTRDNPLQIFPSQARGEGPELFLIFTNVLNEWNQQPVLGVGSRL